MAKSFNLLVKSPIKMSRCATLFLSLLSIFSTSVGSLYNILMPLFSCPVPLVVVPDNSLVLL